MTIPERVRGMQDIFGEYQKYFNFIKKVARHEFRKNGFTRIHTPILEKIELITKSIGESSDIVSKEMYVLKDKKDRELVLKPESTAGVMRAYLENFLSEPQPISLYYIEPHFRYDRPQKGRFRQFHQIGAEIIGEQDPVLDANLIFIGANILDSCGLKGKYKIKLNSLGILKEREKYLEELKSFFVNKTHILDELDLYRLEKNPLRVLDSKNPDTRELIKFAPKMTDFLKKDSKEFYEKVKDYLGIFGIEFEEDSNLVRGLDYYCHTVWEFVDNSGRSQDAFGGGGRYDDLSKYIGHKTSVPGSGFALGAERIIDAVIDSGIKLKNKDAIHVYFIQLGEEAKKVTIKLNKEAHERGLNSLISLGTPSLSIQMKKANKLNARYVVIIGMMEAKNGVCQIKDMEAGTQKELKIGEVLDYIVDKIGPKDLDFYEPAKDLII
ncbi:MAG: histidine--tRNA ligase [Candidatus Gracilibacteria bacterium]|nr:histidine--tRNA ligase [Candidatus Gracilibacteria bacterium]MDD3119953.1 histidine--tRNA ligase [Candidatus Gracilibacteria bacterium]MDD4529939.1 histidine--tRNA ligase [Candidatus Gracilibacteria bacterium]